ncbi:DUF1738 domain-containing protein [Agrobacterium tumefaciens]|uniref:ArdC family protein n=1 Tax=Agrobacterium tumefaciens TaxID=358 RepID=UPI0009BA592C|nr:ArdC-like ssDNA-binding domain-containing protein [Agrobacterium tumefaciens]AYM84853.1 antirestriction protein [Agrobacterium tumefaciens]NTE95085.1 DUF1738 domain-containing protein [Agrobacterium tumefaciens]
MRAKQSGSRMDVYARITDRIIADLEKGVRPWVQPWNAGNVKGRITRPLRFNGQPYTGMNVLLLWSESLVRGFASTVWMTLRQANELGAHIRKGESGATVVYASRFTRTETDAGGGEVERDIPFLKAYTVFNCDQIDGLPDHYYRQPEPVADPVDRIEHAERFFVNTGAVIRHGGTKAFFSPSGDTIQMPPFESFRDAESYYATLGHECVHNADIRIMPTSAQMSRKWSPPAHRSRHNQRDSRKASSLSSGRYLFGFAAGAVTRASAFSLSRRSA